MFDFQKAKKTCYVESAKETKLSIKFMLEDLDLD